MKPWVDYHESEQARMRANPQYALACLKEALKCFDEGEPEVGASMMRDVIGSGVRFSVMRPRVRNHRRRESAGELVEA